MWYTEHTVFPYFVSRSECSRCVLEVKNLLRWRIVLVKSGFFLSTTSLLSAFRTWIPVNSFSALPHRFCYSLSENP